MSTVRTPAKKQTKLKWIVTPQTVSSSLSKEPITTPKSNNSNGNTRTKYNRRTITTKSKKSNKSTKSTNNQSSSSTTNKSHIYTPSTTSTKNTKKKIEKEKH